MEYIDYTAGGYPDPSEALADPAHLQQHNQPHQHQHPQHHQNQQQMVQQPQPGPSALQDAAARAAYFTQGLPQPGSCDIKPRLNKEQHDFLETKYQEQPKPNTHTKKGFAESLCVSLDKVNNWFQNRRAKTKQDIKKAQGAVNLAQMYQSNNMSSDTEPSPYQPSAQYAAMMQQFGNDGQMGNGLGIGAIQQSHAGQHMQIPTYLHDPAASQQLENFAWNPSDDLYDMSQDDLNRRTWTQESFNAISRNGGMVDGQGRFEGLHTGFSNDQDILHQVFGEMTEQDMKQGDLSFPYPTEAPLSSSDSTVPSTISDQSYEFPSNNMMQSQASLSADSLEWADSRSSSLSMLQQDSSVPDMSASQSSLQTTMAQWQPGQSVPVDVSKHYEEFRQASQARSSEAQAFEQPLDFQSDRAYGRRSSQASMLAQSMGNVNIHTPLSAQTAIFKSPAAPTNIAARRQRPRPANLGLAALRSASYSGAGQPGSPGPATHAGHLTQDQQLRRIRSAAVMTGGVAQGRIMKSTPGSAQRSPVNWTFSNALVSPHLVRNMSHGSLAPPTPMSPHEFMQQEQSMQNNLYQTQSHIAHHPSISETSLEHSIVGVPYHPSASVPAQNFSSPPHTPMYYDHPLMSRVGNHVITENTPPQSAPAGQSCFPPNIFATGPPPPQPSYQHIVREQFQTQGPTAPPPQPQQQPPTTTPFPDQGPFHHHAPPQPQQQQQQQQPTVTFAPSQQSNVTTGPPPGIPLQFANGIPTVTAEGTVKMSFPPQAQLMQQQSQQRGTPPLTQFAFITTSGGSPSVAATAGAGGAGQQMPGKGGELFVHEYSPPENGKRVSGGSAGVVGGVSSASRKAGEGLAKSYTFANHSSVDFEEKKAKAKAAGEGREGSVSTAGSVTGGSPASSVGTGVTFT